MRSVTAGSGGGEFTAHSHIQEKKSDTSSFIPRTLTPEPGQFLETTNPAVVCEASQHMHLMITAELIQLNLHRLKSFSGDLQTELKH